MVSWFGAVQSQLFAGGAWGIGQRCIDLDEPGFRAAFDAGAILRTHVLRPTWHFVTPADLRWMQQLTAPAVQAANALYYRRGGLDDALFHRCAEIVYGGLEGGLHLTRAEIAELLARKGIDAAGNRLAYIVMWCELEALICSGPMRGRQHTYALVDERTSGSSQDIDAVHDREGALAELARRYFTSHGPALIRDFAWWSGLRITEARRAVNLAGDLAEQRIEGQVYFCGPEAVGPAVSPDAGDQVRLLPNYDEFVVAYQDRSALFSSAGQANGYGGMDALTNNLVVHQGQVVGTWKPQFGAGRVRVAVTGSRASEAGLLVRQAPALEGATARYGRFLGLPADLELVSQPS